MNMLGVIIWPLGWAVASLVTRQLMLNAKSLGMYEYAGGDATGTIVWGHQMYYFTIVCGLWIIFSTLVAPLAISVALTKGANIGSEMFGRSAGMAGAASGAGAQAAVTAATAGAGGATIAGAGGAAAVMAGVGNATSGGSFSQAAGGFGGALGNASMAARWANGGSNPAQDFSSANSATAPGDGGVPNPSVIADQIVAQQKK